MAVSSITVGQSYVVKFPGDRREHVVRVKGMTSTTPSVARTTTGAARQVSAYVVVDEDGQERTALPRNFVRTVEASGVSASNTRRVHLRFPSPGLARSFKNLVESKSWDAEVSVELDNSVTVIVRGAFSARWVKQQAARYQGVSMSTISAASDQSIRELVNDPDATDYQIKRALEDDTLNPMQREMLKKKLRDLKRTGRASAVSAAMVGDDRKLELRPGAKVEQMRVALAGAGIRTKGYNNQFIVVSGASMAELRRALGDYWQYVVVPPHMASATARRKLLERAVARDSTLDYDQLVELIGRPAASKISHQGVRESVVTTVDGRKVKVTSTPRGYVITDVKASAVSADLYEDNPDAPGSKRWAVYTPDNATARKLVAAARREGIRAMISRAHDYIVVVPSRDKYDAKRVAKLVPGAFFNNDTIGMSTVSDTGRRRVKFLINRDLEDFMDAVNAAGGKAMWGDTTMTVDVMTMPRGDFKALVKKYDGRVVAWPKHRQPGASVSAASSTALHFKFPSERHAEEFTNDVFRLRGGLRAVYRGTLAVVLNAAGSPYAAEVSDLARKRGGKPGQAQTSAASAVSAASWREDFVFQGAGDGKKFLKEVQTLGGDAYGTQLRGIGYQVVIMRKPRGANVAALAEKYNGEPGPGVQASLSDSPLLADARSRPRAPVEAKAGLGVRSQALPAAVAVQCAATTLGQLRSEIYQRHILKSGTLAQLIEWLSWNDPNGEYEGFTLQQAREAMKDQLED